MQADESKMNDKSQREVICDDICKEIRGEFHKDRDGKVGVLLLHGFTSALDAVSGLLPTLDEMNIPYEMPVLRGHNATPDALRGVRATDWYEDALAALGKLCERVDIVVVVGLSMGGVVALNLCSEDHPYRNRICGCVTWAAALGFVNPLSWLAKPLALFVPTWRGQDSFNDAECRKNNHNYQKFPTKAFVELYDYAGRMRKELHHVTVPLCIIQSKLDQVVPWKMSQLIFREAGSAYCEWYSLSRSGHELGQDCEADTVFKLTAEFVRKWM